MPKQTEIGFGYYVDGEMTDPETEQRRWNAIDVLLRGLYRVIGNGVLDGWTIAKHATGLAQIVIAPGEGVVSSISVRSQAAVALGPLTLSSQHFIYAQLTPSSPWNASVDFVSFLSGGDRPESLFLGTVATDGSGVSTIDISQRQRIGFLGSIQDLIRAHRHDGAENNPSPVDLASEVEGVLAAASIPELDASVIRTGRLDPKRVPLIDHQEGLLHRGVLTHPQMDSIADALTHPGRTVLGETTLTNFLQLILALKHQWPEIDEYLVNELAFIPGISPDSFIDAANTTAEVDTRTAAEGGLHRILGTPAGGGSAAAETLTKTWDSNAEMAAAERSRLVADGDLLRLQPAVTTVFVEDFENVSDWTTKIIDSASSTAGSSSALFELDSTSKVQGGFSGRLRASSASGSGALDITLLAEKTFASQDWSDYKKLVFHLQAGADHGDLSLFVRDAVAGTQDSLTLVLERSAPTINRDTLLAGWREIVVDISRLQRSAIQAIGFHTSTQAGWDASRPLQFNLDNLYLTTGNRFVADGFARFLFEVPGFPQRYTRVRWDALLPSGSVLKVRARLAQDLSELDASSGFQSTWSAYRVSDAGGHDELVIGTAESPLFNYAQIEVFMESSSDGAVSPELQRLYLDYESAGTEARFTYDTQDQWESGSRVNLDTTSVPGSIRIAGSADVGGVRYASQGEVVRTDSDLNVLPPGVDGSVLPRSFSQVRNNETTGFGQISAVVGGENDSVWVADTDQDRIVQLSGGGSLLFALYGSTLEEEITGGSPRLLQALYHAGLGLLTLLFDRNLEQVHDSGSSLRKAKFFLGAQTHRIYFGTGTAFRLLGIDGALYDRLRPQTSAFASQFRYQAHGLQIQLSQIDQAVLGSIVDFARPSLQIQYPTPNAVVSTGDLTVQAGLTHFALEEGNRIRSRLDFGVFRFHSSSTFLLGGLAAGAHHLEAALVDKNDNPLSNPEAGVAFDFLTQDAAYTEPLVTILAPVPGAVSTAASLNISFAVSNHALTPSGSHLRYTVDDGLPSEHRTADPIALTGLTVGPHSIRLYLADEFGNEAAGAGAGATLPIVVGISSLTGLTVYVESDAVKSSDRSAGTQAAALAVEVAPVRFANLHAPIDLQFLADEVTPRNPGGAPSLVVAKLATPSWLTSLQNAVVPENERYLDGHSVVQMGLDGRVLFSDSNASFAASRADAKIWLGSAEKISAGEVLIADPLGKRALIVAADLDRQTSLVAWEYRSDRAVSDFHVVARDNPRIVVDDSAATPADLFVRRTTTVIWKNASLVPITILSGLTTASQFAADPDLSLYGDEFLSPELRPGEQFAFTFVSLGIFHWFAHPAIITGAIRVSEGRIASTDEYILTENDTTQGSVLGGRVVKVDAWGNIIWSFGESYLYRPRDARSLPDGSVIISV